VDDKPATLETVGAVILTQDAELPATETSFGREVRYNNWVAHFPGQKESEIKLIGNRARIDWVAEEAGQVQIQFRPFDKHSCLVTNHTILLSTEHFKTQKQIKSEEIAFTCPVKKGSNEITFVDLETAATNQSGVTLADFTITAPGVR
jgi:hypothetical protein